MGLSKPGELGLFSKSLIHNQCSVNINIYYSKLFGDRKCQNCFPKLEEKA